MLRVPPRPSASPKIPPVEELWDFVVIGGGAAGFFAAITCAEASRPPARILILEKTHRPLAKVLVSGGGRCNVTHACDDPGALAAHYPRGGDALLPAFHRFAPRHTVQWFERRGVRLKTETDGRIFPVSDSSETIVNCLLETARKQGIVLRTGAAVAAIQPPAAPGEPFVLQLRTMGEKTEVLHARRLLLATGGDKNSLRLPEKLGHTLEPPVPSLFTFACRDSRITGLAGIAVLQVSLRLLGENLAPPRLPGLQQNGALLITHWGLSGPAVLRLSAWGARWLHERQYRATLEINWLAAPTNQQPDQLTNQLSTHKSRHARQRVDAHNPFPAIPLRLWKQLVAEAAIGSQNWGDVSKPALRRLAEELTQGRYAIHGKGAFKEEFVTCGGVRLDEVDFRTMESRLIPSLYFAGEILDVDGLTGGFNFQNAWTTGWMAGKAAQT